MSSSAPARASMLALLLLVSLGAAPPSAAPPDAETIFENARTAWSSGAYPRYASYATVVDYHNGTHHVRRTWDTIEDFRHESVFARKFSREEEANPGPPPRGIDIAIPFFGSINPEKPADPVGHVALAVDQSYGIASSQLHISAATSVSEFDAKASTLTVIGHTGVVARVYAVRLIDTDVDDGGTEYHLGLTPLHDPSRYRLRELWVDGTTWLTQKAIVAGIGNRSPLMDVSWRVDFRQTDGATYIAQETALADLDYGGAGKLQDVTISFDEFTPTALPTGWKFAMGMSDDKPLSDP
jgi:hypothetical protein